MTDHPPKIYIDEKLHRDHRDAPLLRYMEAFLDPFQGCTSADPKQMKTRLPRKNMAQVTKNT